MSSVGKTYAASNNYVIADCIACFILSRMHLQKLNNIVKQNTELWRTRITDVPLFILDLPGLTRSFHF